MTTFNDYLWAKFIKENPQILDEDISDTFDAWLEQFDVARILELVEEYEKEKSL